MKAEMKIKTGDWSALKKGNRRSERTKGKWGRNRLSVVYRPVACFLLLSLLAVGSYLGAQPQPVQTTAAPLAQTALVESDVSGMEYEEIHMQREADRKEEIALLDSVIDHAQTDDATKKEAMAQKMELAQRMETESAIQATLAHMGFEQAEILCGAGRITLIVPENGIRSEDDTLRLIDAAAAVGQIEAKDVKIILVKK